MRFNLKYVFVISLFCVIQSPPSNAFSLPDHSLITSQAIAEFNQCVPHAFSDADYKTLDHSNAMEDLNLLNKWIRYSHYYRPLEALDFFWRTDSRARVSNLSSQSLNLETLGAILHYLQDAASPPHVVPVSHGLTDGFETYPLTDVQLLVDSQKGNDCAKLLQPIQNPTFIESLLVESGTGTLRLLTEFQIHAKSGEIEQILPAIAYWKEAPFDSSRKTRPFGEYGELGNSYGKTDILIHDQPYTVSLSEYDRVKVNHLRWGVEVSKKLLAYGWTHAKKPRPL